MILKCLLMSGVMVGLCACESGRGLAFAEAAVSVLEARGTLKTADAEALRLGSGILLGPVRPKPQGELSK